MTDTPAITFAEAEEIAAERGFAAFQEWCNHIDRTWDRTPDGLKTTEERRLAYRRHIAHAAAQKAEP